jgi:hypothetical protein
VQVSEGGAVVLSILRQDDSEVLTVFEGLRARLEQFLAERTVSPDPRARAAALQAALIEAKISLGSMRDGLTVTERELTVERKQLEDAERRGQLAAQVPDPETVAVAERFAAKHRERVGVLERKLAVQWDELALAEREIGEMTEAFRAAKLGTTAGPSPSQQSAWRDIEAAGGTRPETDGDDALLRHRLDRASIEAAAEAQLAHLKKKLGKDKQ